MMLIDQLTYHTFLLGVPNRARAGAAGLYMRALCEGVYEVLNTYNNIVLSMEQKLLSDPTLPVTHILQLLRQTNQDIIIGALHDCVSEIDAGLLRGGQLLDLLFRRSCSGVPPVKRCMERLLHYCHKVRLALLFLALP